MIAVSQHFMVQKLPAIPDLDSSHHPIVINTQKNEYKQCKVCSIPSPKDAKLAQMPPSESKLSYRFPQHVCCEGKFVLSSPLDDGWMNYMKEFRTSMHFKRTGSDLEGPDPARDAIGVPTGKNGINISRYSGLPVNTTPGIETHHQYVFVKPNKNDIGSLRCPWEIIDNGSALAFYHPSSYSFGMLEWLEHVLQLLKEYANITCNGSVRFVGEEGNPHWVRSCRGTITVNDSVVSVTWAKHTDEHRMKDDTVFSFWKDMFVPVSTQQMEARPDERSTEHPLVPLSRSRSELSKNKSKLPLHGGIKIFCPNCLEPCGVNTLLFKQAWCSICTKFTPSGEWLQEDTKPGAWDRQRDRATAFAMGAHGGRLGENSVLRMLNPNLVEMIWNMQSHT